MTRELLDLSSVRSFHAFSAEEGTWESDLCQLACKPAQTLTCRWTLELGEVQAVAAMVAVKPRAPWALEVSSAEAPIEQA
mmetsp:Transcript_85526/g.151370  ORF Transcript_85526/g.151370 Transcript_85526/m.151370 type:complete len:80 (-) Transcript_85526:1374-1613(-)